MKVTVALTVKYLPLNNCDYGRKDKVKDSQDRLLNNSAVEKGISEHQYTCMLTKIKYPRYITLFRFVGI